MFSKRRSSSAQRPSSRSTLSAAAAAASQAYVNTSQNASLSSAAAAAALRSHATTPEPVGNLQTKRMMRRGSISSVTSGNGVGGAAQGVPGLQRSNSSSSMTGRTFRVSSPSPSRANGTRSPQVIAAPPVPPLPTTLRSGTPKRASSTGPPQRVMSPTPTNGKRSMSVDKTMTFPKTLRGTNKLANVPERTPSVTRPASVNFSRPRVGSPEPSPTQRIDQMADGLSSDTTSRATIDANISSLDQAVNPNARSAQKKSVPAPIQANAPQPQEMEYVMAFDLNSRTFVRTARPKPVEAEPPSPIVDHTPQLKPGDYDPATRSIVPMPKPIGTDSSIAKKAGTASDFRPPPRNPARMSPSNSPSMSPRPAGFLHKQPSVVREEPDAERAAEAAAENIASLPRPATSYHSQQTPAKSYVSASSHQRSTSLDVPRGAGDPRGRGGSLSPSRSTRFSAAPVLEGTMHEPLRGVSPGKSAMKHSPSSSIRTASPVATFSSATVVQSAPSDVSDTTSLASIDGSGKKKRSVRVSFDDGVPVPPLPAATITPTKVTRTIEVTSDDEQDETMQPRPALPSFGSVRRKRVENDVAQKVTESSPDRGRITPEPSSSVAPSKANGSLPAQVISKDTAPSTDNTQAAVPRSASDDAVPAINLHPPTPAADDEVKRQLDNDDQAAQLSDSQVLSNLASGVIYYGDESDDSRPRRPIEHRPAQLARKDSDAEEFSDAPESQQGVDSAGFASLDAIVGSPLSSPVRTSAPASGPLSAIPESPRSAKALSDGSGSPPRSPTSPTADWTAATAYWSKLTKEKRAQHERDHLSSDDEAKPKLSFFKRNKKNKEIPSTTTAPRADQTPSPGAKSAPAPIEFTPISDTTVNTAPESPNTAAVPPVKSVPPSVAPKQPLKPALKKTDQAPDAKSRPQSAVQTGAANTAAERIRPASLSHINSYASASSVTSGPKAPRDPAPIAATSHTAAKLGKKFQDDSDSESSFRKKRTSATGVDSQGRYNMRRSMRAGSVDSSSRMTSPPPSGRARQSSLLRSLSPSSITSGRERGESLRQSLRGGPPDAGVRTLRGPKPAPQAKARPATSSSMTSRFKSRFVDSDDEDDVPRSAVRPARQSRFADSDEEGDFKISDALAPVRGIPKRRGQEDGDSTDLEDESEAERRLGSPTKKTTSVNAIVADSADIEKAMDAARRKLGIADPKAAPAEPGEALQRRTMRDRDNDKVLIPDVMSDGGSVIGPSGKKKRGFMSSFLKRNRSSSHSVPQDTSSAPPLPTVASPKLDTASTPQSVPKQKDETPASPLAAKLVRRSSQQSPRLQRGNSGFSVATAPAAHSRSNMSDEHWPLPPPIPADRMDLSRDRDTERPQTSDEALQSLRPSERPQNRRSFSARVGFTDEAIAHSERDESVIGSNTEAAVYSQRTGRKKRFGLLRRAFGLYD